MLIFVNWISFCILLGGKYYQVKVVVDTFRCTALLLSVSCHSNVLNGIHFPRIPSSLWITWPLSWAWHHTFKNQPINVFASFVLSENWCFFSENVISHSNFLFAVILKIHGEYTGDAYYTHVCFWSGICALHATNSRWIMRPADHKSS